MCSSDLFDEEGSNLIDKTIIKDGVVRDFYGSNVFSQYVKKENTGNLRIIQLEKGSLNVEDLNGQTYLECLQFSGIQCNILSDYLGGEVRLAILHIGDKKIPVGGFSISGKLSEFISHVKLSNKTSKLPNYFGPSFMLLKDFNVL